MDADDLGHGGGEHAEGVIIPDVLLGGERQPLQIVQGADVFRFHPGFVQAAAIERHQVINPLHHRLEALEL